MVPGHLVPHNGSPIDWSLWTNSPQTIRSPWTDGPQKFEWSPTNLVPLDKWSLEYSVSPGGQAVGIQKYGTEFVRDHLCRGINFMGIVCPGRQEVGDRKSRDQIGSGPNASQPDNCVQSISQKQKTSTKVLLSAMVGE